MTLTDSGLLIVDKPQGVTSHDIVAAVRGVLHMKRVGHAGTLDPMATGVLVVGFGNATRLLNVIVEHDKTYEATIRLGQRTTTDDADGEIVSTRPAPAMSREALQAVVDVRFTGTIEQVPNAYSAIKINGQRAYDLARDGQEVRLKARPVTIHEFAVLDARPVLVATAAGEQSGANNPAMLWRDVRRRAANPATVRCPRWMWMCASPARPAPTSAPSPAIWARRWASAGT